MYGLLRPMLFALDPARAHRLAMAALGVSERMGMVRRVTGALTRVEDPRLVVEAMGLRFPTPIGLAGGFDKNAERPRALAALGFGHLEVGTVTGVAQEANPTPNMFRLPADRALVNRLGFPNHGAAVVAERLRGTRVGVPLGVSIGKSRSVPLDGAIDDYVTSLRAVRDVADFVVVNVSSPNTKDLRAMQATEIARPLFAALSAETDRPLLVKIAPDLPDEAVDAICDEAKSARFAGVVATNTTISREGLVTDAASVSAVGPGGLSGRPLFPRSLAIVGRVRARLGPKACVIGVGGIDSLDTMLAMLRAGADLVQLYTGFVYRGPTLPADLARQLLAKIDEAGARDLSGLVQLAVR